MATRRLRVSLLAVAACAAAFVAVLGGTVEEGGLRAFDEQVLLAFRSPVDRADPVGPGWLEELARDVTGLGGVAVLTFLTAACAGFLLLQRKTHLAAYVALAVSGGVLLTSLLKAGFGRARPDLVPHGQEVLTSSFPSGHSMMSAVVFLTLGVLLARTLQGRALRAYVIALAVLLSVAVGISRVYLGVHWPTDVLAGWAAGAAWALACWALASWLRSRGRIE